MTKLYVSQRVPPAYDKGRMGELWRLAEEQANALAEGRIIARHGAMTAAPTAGNWVKGDLVDNSAPGVVSSAISDYVIVGWICTASGTPGTWKERRVLIEDITIDTSISGGTLLTNSLSGDVSMNNTANYFTGPIVSQGTTGTWWASGNVTLLDTAGAANFQVKLWDGTTVIASADMDSAGANSRRVFHLSGYIASPAGDIRISCKDATSASGVIKFNQSGNSKDSTLSVIRVA